MDEYIDPAMALPNLPTAAGGVCISNSPGPGVTSNLDLGAAEEVPAEAANLKRKFPPFWEVCLEFDRNKKPMTREALDSMFKGRDWLSGFLEEQRQSYLDRAAKLRIGRAGSEPSDRRPLFTGWNRSSPNDSSPTSLSLTKQDGAVSCFGENSPAGPHNSLTDGPIRQSIESNTHADVRTDASPVEQSVQQTIAYNNHGSICSERPSPVPFTPEERSMQPKPTLHRLDGVDTPPSASLGRFLSATGTSIGHLGTDRSEVKYAGTRAELAIDFGSYYMTYKMATRNDVPLIHTDRAACYGTDAYKEVARAAWFGLSLGQKFEACFKKQSYLLTNVNIAARRGSSTREAFFHKYLPGDEDFVRDGGLQDPRIMSEIASNVSRIQSDYPEEPLQTTSLTAMILDNPIVIKDNDVSRQSTFETITGSLDDAVISYGPPGGEIVENRYEAEIELSFGPDGVPSHAEHLCSSLELGTQPSFSGDIQNLDTDAISEETMRSLCGDHWNKWGNLRDCLKMRLYLENLQAKADGKDENRRLYLHPVWVSRFADDKENSHGLIDVLLAVKDRSDPEHPHVSQKPLTWIIPVRSQDDNGCYHYWAVSVLSHRSKRTKTLLIFDPSNDWSRTHCMRAELDDFDDHMIPLLRAILQLWRFDHVYLGDWRDHFVDHCQIMLRSQMDESIADNLIERCSVGHITRWIRRQMWLSNAPFHNHAPHWHSFKRLDNLVVSGKSNAEQD